MKLVNLKHVLEFLLFKEYFYFIQKKKQKFISELTDFMQKNRLHFLHTFIFKKNLNCIIQTIFSLNLHLINQNYSQVYFYLKFFIYIWKNIVEKGFLIDESFNIHKFYPR